MLEATFEGIVLSLWSYCYPDDITFDDMHTTLSPSLQYLKNIDGVVDSTFTPYWSEKILHAQ